MKLDTRSWIAIGLILLLTILLVPSGEFMLASDAEPDAESVETSATPAPENDTTPTPTPTISPTPSPSPTPGTYELLQMRDRGDKREPVARLQERLILLGFLTGTADGYFGEATFRAVSEFQRVNGLTADGLAGAETQRVLFESDQVLDVNERLFVSPSPTAEQTQTPIVTTEPDAPDVAAPEAAPESAPEDGAPSGYGFKLGPITGYGLVCALAVAMFMLTGIYMCRFYKGIGLMKFMGFLLPAFICSLLMSRLLYCLTHIGELPGLLSALMLWRGGYSLLGALLGLWLAGTLFTRRHNIAREDLLDLMTPGALVFVFIIALAGHLRAQTAGLPVETEFLAKGMFTVKDASGVYHHVYRWEAIAAFVMLLYTAFRFRALFLQGEVFRLFALAGLGALSLFEGMKRAPGVLIGSLPLTQALYIVAFGWLCFDSFLKAKKFNRKHQMELISEGLIGFGLILMLVFGLLASGINAELVMLIEFIGVACALAGALISRRLILTGKLEKPKPRKAAR